MSLPEGYTCSSNVLNFVLYTLLGRNWTFVAKFQTTKVTTSYNKHIHRDTGAHTNVVLQSRHGPK